MFTEGSFYFLINYTKHQIFDADEIRNVFRREDVLPHRPAMPSLHYYKGVLRKDFFGDNPGMIGV